MMSHHGKAKNFYQFLELAKKILNILVFVVFLLKICLEEK